MRSTGAIRQKLKQVKWRYLKKLLAAKLAPRPVNCVHNGLIQIPENGNHGPSAGLHICTLKLVDGSWDGGVCDEDHGGLQRAQGCPHFQPSLSKDALKDEFNRFFENANYGEIAYLYPMAASLIWVLEGDEGDDESGESGDLPQEEPASETPQMPAQATLDKLQQPEADPDQGEVLGALESLREQLQGLQENLPKMISTLVQKETADLGERVGDLSESTLNTRNEIQRRLDALEAQPPAKIGWFDRLLGRGLDG